MPSAWMPHVGRKAHTSRVTDTRPAHTQDAWSLIKHLQQEVSIFFKNETGGVEEIAANRQQGSKRIVLRNYDFIYLMSLIIL